MNIFTRKQKPKIDGSLSTPAYNIKEEILKAERELAEATVVADLAKAPGWAIIVGRLKENIESSAMNVINYSHDPLKNQNLIIAEGAKRERDMALISFVADAQKQVIALTQQLETLNQSLQDRTLQKATPHFGPERK